MPGKPFFQLGAGGLHQNGGDENHAFDGVVDEGVHFQRRNDLVDDGIAQGAKEDAQGTAFAACWMPGTGTSARSSTTTWMSILRPDAEACNMPTAKASRLSLWNPCGAESW